jgi:hypothetical protein
VFCVTGSTSGAKGSTGSSKSTSKVGEYIGFAFVGVVVLGLIVCLVCRYCTGNSFRRTRLI